MAKAEHTAAPAAEHHKTAAGKIIASAQKIISGILSTFHGDSLDKKSGAAIIAKGMAIAQQLHNGKLDQETLDTTETFLHGLLLNQHVLNLTDQQITDLVNKAVDLAQAFLANKK